MIDVWWVDKDLDQIGMAGNGKGQEQWAIHEAGADECLVGSGLSRQAMSTFLKMPISLEEKCGEGKEKQTVSRNTRQKRVC